MVNLEDFVHFFSERTTLSWYYSRTRPWPQIQAAFLRFQERNTEARECDVYALSLCRGPARPIKFVSLNITFDECTRHTEATWYAALRVCATPKEALAKVAKCSLKRVHA